MPRGCRVVDTVGGGFLEGIIVVVDIDHLFASSLFTEDRIQ